MKMTPATPVRLAVLAVLAVAGTLTLAATPALRAQDLGIQVGAQAPAAKVETLDGKPADLSQFIGKSPTLIEFWATWCASCQQLEPSLLAVHKKYAGQVKFVGVAVSVHQSPERIRLYARKHGLTHDIVYDRTGAASAAYDAPATSYIVVLDRDGKVVYTGLGGDQDLEAAVKKAM